MRHETKTKRDIYRDNKALIWGAIGLTELQYCYLVFEEGQNFLNAQCRHDEAEIMAVQYQAFYWRWWVEQWNQRDAEFIAYHTLAISGYDPVGEAKGRKPQTMLKLKAYGYWHKKAITDEMLSLNYQHLTSTMAKKLLSTKTENYFKQHLITIQ